MIDRLGYQNIQTHFVDFDKERSSGTFANQRVWKMGHSIWAPRMILVEHQIYRSAKDDMGL